jgi:hypothetical protein
MFRRDLHETDTERAAHLAALEQRKIVEGYSGNFTFLYEALSILDAKASSLLTFNAVGLTALAIWLANIPLNFFHLALDLAFLGFLASCALCLKIVWLHWVSTADLKSDDRYPVRLLEVRDSRTVLYRWAWLLAVFAVAVTGLAAVHHTFETLFTVYFSRALNLYTDSATSGSPGF